MYIGDTDDGSGLHHLIYEVLDNSIDEALAGHCNNISVTLNSDNSVTVEDNGRGIPTEIHPQEKISAAEVIMTQLHAGGKFDNSSYKVSGGLHGVGVSAVNAVSEWMEVTIHRDGVVYNQRYEAGVPVKPLGEIGDCTDTGTLIVFKPDLNIFTNITEFDFDQIDTRLKETSFLNAGLKIHISDNRSDDQDVSLDHYEGGLSEYVSQINSGREILHNEVIQITGHKEIEKGPVSVDLALQWSNAFSESIRCYTNIIRNKDGGTPVSYTHLTLPTKRIV